MRNLIERAKQIILMSHNARWLEMVCSGCRTLNGRYYEITGYTQAGPYIAELCWVRWKDRLNDVDSIFVG